LKENFRIDIGDLEMDLIYQHQALTRRIIGSAIEVHKVLGPGLLESAYRLCLAFEFERQGLHYQQELVAPILYKERKIDCGFRLDFLIENAVVLELKSVESVLPVHEAQLLTYLRLTNKQVGLLINFNVPQLKDGIYRRVLNVFDLDYISSCLSKDSTSSAPRKSRGAENAETEKKE
jgi:GxxExxY protein